MDNNRINEIEYTDFYKAIEHILAGKVAKRKDWSKGIFLQDCFPYALVYRKDNGQIENYLIFKKDILAKDWILL